MGDEFDEGKLRDIKEAWSELEALAEACVGGSASTRHADEGRAHDALERLLLVLERIFGKKD